MVVGCNIVQLRGSPMKVGHVPERSLAYILHIRVDFGYKRKE